MNIKSFYAKVNTDELYAIWKETGRELGNFSAYKTQMAELSKACDKMKGVKNKPDFIPASNESKSCLHDLDDCREGRIPRLLGRFKFDAPLLAAGYLTDVYPRVNDIVCNLEPRRERDVFVKEKSR